MNRISLAFGSDFQDCALPEEWKGEIIESGFTPPDRAFQDLVRDALRSPLGSPRLSEIVKPGETVCIVFSDITRSWQRTDLYLPLIVEELEKGGILPEDIVLLSALGTHRPHTEEETRRLTGELYGKYRIVDHNCDDHENMVLVGKTSRGTEVELNRLAVEADRLILTGGLVFHMMAGYSAGRKSLVPGISSRKTIMENHSLSMAPEVGKGSHPLIGCDRLENNPVHEDMSEAQTFVNPDFIVNVIPGKEGPGGAVAGEPVKAHQEACRLLRDFFLIPIPEKRDLVIASAGGFPADINFYQSIKSLMNSVEALNEGGTMILVNKCNEGLGNPLMEEMIGEFSTMLDREIFLRKNYTIGRFIAYYGCEIASKHKVILVTDMNEPSLSNAGIVSFPTLQEAVDYTAGQLKSRPESFWLIPDAGHSFPKVKG